MNQNSKVLVLKKITSFYKKKKKTIENLRSIKKELRIESDRNTISNLKVFRKINR